MRKEDLTKLGFRVKTDMPATVILGEGTNEEYCQLSSSDRARAQVLRELLSEYQACMRRLSDSPVNSSPEAVAILAPGLSTLDHEELWVLYTNKRNVPLRTVRISSGGKSSTLFDVQMIMRQGLLLGATGFIICHNHPSGDPHPSTTDLNATKNLRDAGQIMGMTLMDHIILSPTCYYSFSDEACTEYKD